MSARECGKMAANPWGEFRADVVEALKGALSGLGWEPPRKLEETLEEPPDPKLGDLATTVCFDLAKALHKSPTWLAAELTKAIKPRGLVGGVEAAGAYVNFFADVSKLAESTLAAIERADVEYGHLDVGRGKKVVIEHTSVNPTKPLHIGHGRNAVIGDTMARILRTLGYGVEVQNYIDDMGRQVAETLLANQLIKRKPRAKFDHTLGLIYVELHKRLEREPKLEGKVREILVQLEREKGRLATLARKLSERCVEANLETTDRLGVSYDLLVWESDIARSGMLREALGGLRKTPYVVEGTGERAGTLILRLADFGIEDKVLVRSDGTAVYTMRDIAYQLWKFGETKTGLLFKLHSKRPNGTRTYTTSTLGRSKRFGRADKVINVIGAEQRFPQQVVFTSLKALGLEREYENSHHLAYEHVWLPSGRFSGRKGTWVGFSVDDVVEDAVARAYIEVEKHNPKASERFKRGVAEIVGVGAVRYALIQTSPEKRVVFKWEEALNFERNSGPAIQYSHARACSILRKARRKGGKYPSDVFKLPEEQRLVKLLAKLPEVLRVAGEGLQPSVPALYAAELALEFNKFYEVAPVIEAERPELRVARLSLVNCTRIALRNVLDVLGIVAPERM